MDLCAKSHTNTRRSGDDPATMSVYFCIILLRIHTSQCVPDDIIFDMHDGLHGTWSVCRFVLLVHAMLRAGASDLFSVRRCTN